MSKGFTKSLAKSMLKSFRKFGKNPSRQRPSRGSPVNSFTRSTCEIQSANERFLRLHSDHIWGIEQRRFFITLHNETAGRYWKELENAKIIQ